MDHSVAVTTAEAHAQATDVAVVVLAAGAGRRLAPLSDLRPKPLCPVGNRALIDLALDRVAPLGLPVAVNLHRGADEIRAHLASTGRDDVHLSEEHPEALGTAGAVGALRSWLDGRDVLILNADTWAPGDLAPFVAGWDRARPSVLVHAADTFGARVGVVASLLPWAEARLLQPAPTGLYEVVWRRCHEAGGLDTVRHDGLYVDCGTPADYLEANLGAASLAGGVVVDPSAAVTPGSVVRRAVIGAGAVVEGRVEDSVVWPGARVAAGEVLVRSVKASAELTLGPLGDGSAPPV
jgi:N-acetyl-alpha-D-muramate 1-phosphate uridylyltransferase